MRHALVHIDARIEHTHIYNLAYFIYILTLNFTTTPPPLSSGFYTSGGRTDVPARLCIASGSLDAGTARGAATVPANGFGTVGTL